MSFSHVYETLFDLPLDSWYVLNTPQICLKMVSNKSKEAYLDIHMVFLVVCYLNVAQKFYFFVDFINENISHCKQCSHTT